MTWHPKQRYQCIFRNPSVLFQPPACRCPSKVRGGHISIHLEALRADGCSVDHISIILVLLFLVFLVHASRIKCALHSHGTLHYYPHHSDPDSSSKIHLPVGAHCLYRGLVHRLGDTNCSLDCSQSNLSFPRLCILRWNGSEMDGDCDGNPGRAARDGGFNPLCGDGVGARPDRGCRSSDVAQAVHDVSPLQSREKDEGLNATYSRCSLRGFAVGEGGN